MSVPGKFSIVGLPTIPTRRTGGKKHKTEEKWKRLSHLDEIGSNNRAIGCYFVTICFYLFFLFGIASSGVKSLYDVDSKSTNLSNYFDIPSILAIIPS